MRNDELENLAMTGFVKGKKARRWKRQNYLTYLNNMWENTPIELIHIITWQGKELFGMKCRYDMAP